MHEVPSLAVTTEVATAAESAAPKVARDEVGSGTLDVLRDIVRGGLAGLIAGVVVAGIGGRLVMRLAALLVPSSDGAFTENGNRIGDITLGGSMAIIIIIGLLFGVGAGSLWVTIRAFLPRARLARAAVSAPIAIALGSTPLIEPTNRDFDVLAHDPLVIASLVILVGLFGPALVLAELWLEPRLPHPAPSDRGTINAFAFMTLLGGLLFVLVVVPPFFAPHLRPVGIALLAVGGATLVMWVARVRGQPIPAWTTVVGRLSLGAAVVLGLSVVVGDVASALRP